MRNLLAFFAAMLLMFLGVGWYLGWYKVQSAPAPPGHRAVNIDVHTDKISEDVRKGKEKLSNALESGQHDESGKHAETNKMGPMKPAAKD
jgi:hypothetical protein